MFDLHGRVALVTGAGQNIGAGIARCLATQGAAVAVNDVVPERAAATVAAIEAAGGRAIVAAFDVTDHAAVVAGVAAAEAVLGPVDILVNNAGNGGTAGMSTTQFHDTDPASWRGAIDVNLYGVMHCCHAVINGMRGRGHGRIITIASGAGTMGLGIGVSPYAGGKGGSIGFMRHLAIENARVGVTANTLAIGLMDSGKGASTEALARAVPVGRTGRPDDIGFACVYLASDEAEWMTGQTIELNGGAKTT